MRRLDERVAFARRPSAVDFVISIVDSAPTPRLSASPKNGVDDDSESASPNAADDEDLNFHAEANVLDGS